MAEIVTQNVSWKMRNQTGRPGVDLAGISSQLADITTHQGDLSKFRPSDADLITKIDNEFIERGVNPRKFGCVLDGVADDTTNFLKVLDYVKTAVSGKILPIKLPLHARLRLSQPIQLFDGFQIFSSVRNAEFSHQATIINESTDMFVLPSDVSDVTIHGICFKGNGTSYTTNFITPVDQSNGYLLKYSLIEKCGFNYFNCVINGRILGTHIKSNFINNGKKAFSLAGSDSIISENFIDNKASLSVNTNSLVTLTSLALSRFENNYLTGSIAQGAGPMPLIVQNGCNGLILSKNWFDYSDLCAVYCNNIDGVIFDANFTRANMRVPAAQYSAIFTLFDTKNTIFKNTQFISQAVNTKTFSFRKTSSGCSNIVIRDSLYTGSYVPVYERPTGESTNIFIDDPMLSTYKPVVTTKSYSSLSLAFAGAGTVNAQSSKTFDITVTDPIPADSIGKIRFWSATPLEDGVIAEIISDGTTTVKVRFTNIKSTSVTLADKSFNLLFMYP